MLLKIKNTLKGDFWSNSIVVAKIKCDREITAAEA